MSDTTTGSVAGSDRAAQERARARAGQQGLLFTDDLPAAARGHRLPRPDRLRGRRHHLPPARLLGAHRPGRARASAAPPAPAASGSTASATSWCSRSSSGCSTPASRCRNPHRRQPPARARRRRPGPDHPDERRRQRLRVHLRRRGRRPASRAARACSASPSAGSGARSRARWPSCRASARDDDEPDVAATGDELSARRKARATG